MILSDEINAIFEKSESKLRTAKINLDSGQYADSISCSYYAVFHIISACLLTKKLTFSSHSQVIGSFNKEFIKNGLFPKNFSTIIQGLFEDRQNGDYNIYFKPDKDSAFDSYKKSQNIINAVKEYIKEL